MMIMSIQQLEISLGYAADRITANSQIATAGITWT